MATVGLPSSHSILWLKVSGWFQYLPGSISKNVSIATCRNGSVVIGWSAFAVELFPELPTPLMIIMQAIALIELTKTGSRI
jgi:hypothetical protein